MRHRPRHREAHTQRGLAPHPARFLLCLACVAVLGASAGTDVESARDRWRALQDQESQVLAPRRHREAATAMKALDTSRGSSAALADAEKKLQALDVAVRRARSVWPDLLDLREEARAAGAPSRDLRGWTTAENVLIAAAQKLEAGRVDAARSQGREAVPLYEKARWNAMRSTLLATADSLRVGLEADQAREFVPRSYVRTLDAISGAEKLLREKGRLDPDVRAAGERAVSEARHGRYILDRIRGACQQKAPDRLESSVLDWEAATRRVLVVMGLDASFETGLGPPLATIEEEGMRLRRERDRLRIDTTQRAGAAESLQARIQEVDDRVHDRDLQIAELRRSLGGFQTVESIQAMFGSDEGRVLIDGRDLVLRLHGIQFASGKSEISPSGQALLDKVVEAMKRLPASRIIVEGHTDSQGRPETNLQLSQARAVAVRDYLAMHASLAPGAITATGYGSMRPVASNDTDEGRALNRRIEIIIARPE